MGITELNNMIQALNSNIDSYWHFFAVVVLGIIGWLLTRQTELRVKQSIALIGGLIAFFIANMIRLSTYTDNLRIVEKARSKLFEQDKGAVLYQINEFKDYMMNPNTVDDRWAFFYLCIAVFTIFLVLYQTDKVKATIKSLNQRIAKSLNAS